MSITSRTLRRYLEKQSVMICCSFMHSLDATQCPEYLRSERNQGSKESSRKNRKWKTLRKCSAHQSKDRMLWKPVAAGQWWHCSIQIRMTPWHLSGTICSARLPPTSSACKFLSLQAYYQVMEWIGWSDEMELPEWGWRFDEQKLIPVMTAKSPAPDVLLQFQEGVPAESMDSNASVHVDNMTNEPVTEEDDEQEDGI